MIYDNYENFKHAIDKMIEKYKGKMGCYLSLTGYVRDYDIIDGKKVPSTGMEVPDISKEIEEVLKDAFERFDIMDIMVYHNKGNLKVGDIITSIYVFAKHRKEGFLACQYVIDQLKKYH